MSQNLLTRLQNLFLNLATEEIFPNLTYRNNNMLYFEGNSNLVYFESERVGSAEAIESILADCDVVDIQNAPYFRAAQEVTQRLRSFDQTTYAKQPDFLKAQRLQEMVDFYVERFGLILDGTNFAGKPMDVKEYVSELSQRRYGLHDGVSVPDSLNVIE
jgi:hypothetical protein